MRGRTSNEADGVQRRKGLAFRRAGAHNGMGRAPRPYEDILMSDLPLMYGDLADWWPVLSSPEDYAEEASIFASVLEAHARRPIRTLLELGSGGGNNASHLKARYAMTLVDISPGMLAVSSALNPECEHIRGDMRTVRLGRRFDAVFVHDAVMYMACTDDLAAVMRAAFEHCEVGAPALFVPDFTSETFAPYTDHGGHDRAGRGLRFLQWTHEASPGGRTYDTDFVYLLRGGGGGGLDTLRYSTTGETLRDSTTGETLRDSTTGEALRDSTTGEELRNSTAGEVRVLHETHTFGLFPREEWLQLLRGVGFEACAVPYDHSEFHEGSRDMFVGVRP